MVKPVPPILPLILVLGCSRLELARDLLGETEVKHRQATAAVDQLAKAVAQITRSRISVQVRYTLIDEDLAAVEQKITRTPEGYSRRSLQAEAESLRMTRDRLGRVLGLLQHREQQARDRLQGLRLLISQIDSKQVALRAVRRAAEVSEGIDFKSIEAEVKELEAAVDAELRFNEVRLDDLNFDFSGGGI